MVHTCTLYMYMCIVITMCTDGKTVRKLSRSIYIQQKIQAVL